jgi:NDP-sugar pyrophosphorylase family protein
MKSMQAVILAAGRGVRLLPLTQNLPKPLVVVCGTTILERILTSLPEAITEVINVIDYKGEMIKEKIGTTYNNKKVIYVPQGEMHATYGALVSAKPYITSEKFLVMGADDIQDTSALEAMVKKDLAFGVHHKILPQKEYLIIDIVDGIVRGMRRPTDVEFEQPQPMATGIYVFDKRIWNYPPIAYKDNEYGIPQTIRPMLLEENMYAVEMPGWMQINSHEELAYAEKTLAQAS